jgi:hypothetical protein
VVRLGLALGVDPQRQRRDRHGVAVAGGRMVRDVYFAHP